MTSTYNRKDLGMTREINQHASLNPMPKYTIVLEYTDGEMMDWGSMHSKPVIILLEMAREKLYEMGVPIKAIVRATVEAKYVEHDGGYVKTVIDSRWLPPVVQYYF